MKFLILILLPLLAHAGEPEGFDLATPQGIVHMEVTDIGEPVYQPYVVELTLKCNGARKKKILIDNISACEVENPVIDEAAKVLSMRVKVSRSMELVATCDTWLPPKTFNLEKECRTTKPEKKKRAAIGD